MPTSSIEKNFVIYGAKQAQIFVDAIDKSIESKKKRQPTNVSVEFSDEPSAIRETLRRWKELYDNKKGED